MYVLLLYIYMLNQNIFLYLGVNSMKLNATTSSIRAGYTFNDEDDFADEDF